MPLNRHAKGAIKPTPAEMLKRHSAQTGESAQTPPIAASGMAENTKERFAQILNRSIEQQQNDDERYQEPR